MQAMWLYSACLIFSAIVVEIRAVNKFIDLTHGFNNETVTWPGRKSTFNIEIEAYNANGIWTASKGFCTSEHTSTHIDAPYHFHKSGRTLDQIPLEDLIDVPGVLIDVYDKVHTYDETGSLKVIQNYALKQQDIVEWENKHGKIPDRAVVLLRTGWESLWGNNKAYLGDESPATEAPTGGDYKPTLDLTKPVKMNFPAFSGEAAKYLTSERNILGVGVDTISIDPGDQSTFFPAHRIFAARSIFMLEMVANLHLLPPRGFNLWAVPFKVDQGTGAPTRVLARIN